MGQVYFLDIDIHDCVAEVFLNDAPIARTTRMHSLRFSPPVSPWAIDGENKLEVMVESDGAGEDARIKVTLSSGEAGSFPEPDTGPVHALIDRRFPFDTDPHGSSITLESRTSLNHPWGTWTWQTAPILMLDDVTVSDLTDFLQSLHAGLDEHRLDLLIAASRIKLEEVGRCFGMTPAFITLQLQAGIQHLFEIPEWSLAPFNAAGLVFRPCCDGRLVQPLTSGGNPVLHQIGPKGKIAWSLDLFIARIDGSFCIVR